MLQGPALPKAKKRDAVYARVSSDKDAMLHSLSAQVDHYRNLIQSRGDWELVGIYVDEALTGTKSDRGQFQQMLADCKAGKIDMIITKSISRFARNTVTLLETVRSLKLMKVDVYFEEQNIHSMSSDGELLLTILASYAQEESLSASENQKWRIRRNFEQGKPCRCRVYGYRYNGEQFIVFPEEAAIIQQIYADYLSGIGIERIAEKLNQQQIPSPAKGPWYKSTVSCILHNYTYTGNLLLQKTYRENHLTKRKRMNKGELPMYHAQGTHEAIIPLSTYETVQAKLTQRSAKYINPSFTCQTYPFTGVMTCGICGKHYRRKVTATQPVWICPTYNSKGKVACPSKQIPESTLTALAQEIGGPDVIESILVKEKNTLVFCLKDGTQVTKCWKDRSRSESWTPEMKAKAKHFEIERRKQNAKQPTWTIPRFKMLSFRLSVS